MWLDQFCRARRRSWHGQRALIAFRCSLCGQMKSWPRFSNSNRRCSTGWRIIGTRLSLIVCAAFIAILSLSQIWRDPLKRAGGNLKFLATILQRRIVHEGRRKPSQGWWVFISIARSSQAILSTSRKALSFSSARTTKRFPSPRFASNNPDSSVLRVNGGDPAPSSNRHCWACLRWFPSTSVIRHFNRCS